MTSDPVAAKSAESASDGQDAANSGLVWSPLILLALGVLLAMVVAGALISFFTASHLTPTVDSLDASGIAAAVVGSGFLLWGTQRRSLLAYELSRSALDLATLVARYDAEWGIGEDGEWEGGNQQEEEEVRIEKGASAATGKFAVGPLSRTQIIALISEYEVSLLQIDALSDAGTVHNSLRDLKRSSVASSSSSRPEGWS